jgi:hypothetical protein
VSYDWQVMTGKISLYLAALGTIAAVICGTIPFFAETAEAKFYQKTAANILLISGVVATLIALIDRSSDTGKTALNVGIVMMTIALVALFVILRMTPA